MALNVAGGSAEPRSAAPSKPSKDPLLLPAWPTAPVAAAPSPAWSSTPTPTTEPRPPAVIDLMYQQRNEFDPNAVREARDALQQTHSLGVSSELPGPEALQSMQYEQQQQLSDDYMKPIGADEARAQLEDALRGQRVHALGIDRQSKPKPGKIHKQVDPMTDEEYYALTPLQRAAVDYNTMLVGAVRRDRRLRNTYAPTPAQQEAYDTQVEKMFGEGAGGMYAPETVNLLQQLDFEDQSARLSDFLGLHATIKESDLEGITPQQVSALPQATDLPPNTSIVDRQQFTTDLATRTHELEVALANGTQLLQQFPSPASAARVNRAEGVTAFGGVPVEPKAALGYGAPEFIDGKIGNLDTYFQVTYENLARQGNDDSSTLADVTAMLTPQEIAAFREYAANRAQQAESFGLPLGTESSKYKTLDEFLKLVQGGSDAAK